MSSQLFKSRNGAKASREAMVPLNVIIDDGFARKSVSLSVRQGSNLLDVTSSLPFEMQVEQHSEFGTWVTAINRLGEQKGFGWQFYIHDGSKLGLPYIDTIGGPAFLGLDNIKISNPMSLEWKYEFYTDDIKVPESVRERCAKCAKGKSKVDKDVIVEDPKVLSPEELEEADPKETIVNPVRWIAEPSTAARYMLPESAMTPESNDSYGVFGALQNYQMYETSSMGCTCLVLASDSNYFSPTNYNSLINGPITEMEGKAIVFKKLLHADSFDYGRAHVLDYGPFSEIGMKPEDSNLRRSLSAVKFKTKTFLGKMEAAWTALTTWVKATKFVYGVREIYAKMKTCLEKSLEKLKAAVFSSFSSNRITASIASIAHIGRNAMPYLENNRKRAVGFVYDAFEAVRAAAAKCVAAASHSLVGPSHLRPYNSKESIIQGIGLGTVSVSAAIFRLRRPAAIMVLCLVLAGALVLLASVLK